MIPRHYFDIEVLGGEAGGGLPLPVVGSVLMKILHGAFRHMPGKFALAFPGKSVFSIIRVFAGDHADLAALVAAVEDHPKIRDYSRLGFPRVVPVDFGGPWVECRRFRIPTRSSDRHEGAPLRAKRLAQAEEGKLPYFHMTSASNGSGFGLYLEIVRHPTHPAGAEDCNPDSYGLSRKTKRTVLPDLK